MTSWIKMGTGLASHGKVKAMRRALKADRLRVIGGLWAVWCVFDEHSDGGFLSGYTLEDMDEEIGWKGFSAAMRDIGWLVEADDGLQAPDYEEHNGPSAKRRALDASRKGKSRAKADAKENTEPDPAPHPVREMSASDADNMRNREDKRREEEEKTARKRAAPVARPPDVSEQVWADWLHLRKAKRAPVTQTTLDGAMAEAVTAGMSLEAFLRAWCRRGSQGLEAAWLTPAERQSGQMAGIFAGAE